MKYIRKFHKKLTAIPEISSQINVKMSGRKQNRNKTPKHFFETNHFKEEGKWSKMAYDKMLIPIDCFATWIDICGFGASLEKCQWDLKTLQEKRFLILLNEVYHSAAKPLLTNPDGLHEKIIILNDGVAKTADLNNKLKLSGEQFLLSYLSHVFILHNYLVSITKTFGLGIRMIIAGGERIQYSPTSRTGESYLISKDHKRSKQGKKLIDTTFTYNPAEFQMNTAFAKAFTADALGTKHDIIVNGFFIEQSFFQKIEGMPSLTGKASVLTNISDAIIQIFASESLRFDLLITKTIQVNLKGHKTNVFHIEKVIAYGEDYGFMGKEFPLNGS